MLPVGYGGAFGAALIALHFNAYTHDLISNGLLNCLYGRLFG